MVGMNAMSSASSVRPIAASENDSTISPAPCGPVVPSVNSEDPDSSNARAALGAPAATKSSAKATRDKASQHAW